MTAVEQYPPGQEPAGRSWGLKPQHQPGGSRFHADDELDAEELTRELAEVEAVLPLQDDPRLLQRKTRPELDAEKRVAATHRGAMLKIQAKRDEAEAGLAELRMKHDSEQAERELKVAAELADAEHRDKLDAAKARGQLNRLTSPIGYIAQQYRQRRLALTLAATPSVLALILGATNVQESWARWLHYDETYFMHYALYGMEPVATLALSSILLFQGGRPGGLRSLKEIAEVPFFWIGLVLLAMSCVIQVLPHLAMGEPEGLGWLWVPFMIVISMHLVPKLNEGYGERIAAARTEAELTAPADHMTSDQSKMARLFGSLLRAGLAGRFRGEDAADGLPSNSSVDKTLRGEVGRVSRPDSLATSSFLRVVNEEIEKPSSQNPSASQTA